MGAENHQLTVIKQRHHYKSKRKNFFICSFACMNSYLVIERASTAQ
uniref:Uncharacterized protein n=1 Tax=Anguilla anguilla TaxID=7936 RepID=A0A0E9W7A6_ANGAN